MEEDALTQGDAARQVEVTSPSEVHTDDDVMERRQEQQDVTKTTQEWVAPPGKDDGNKGPELWGAANPLRHHPKPTGHQLQTSKVGTREGAAMHLETE